MSDALSTRWLPLAAVLSLAGGLVATPARAQTIRDTITGTVTDSTGAVVPGITVTVTNAATGISASAVTAIRAITRSPSWPPGRTRPRSSRPASRSTCMVGVQIAQTTRLDIGLQVGAMSEAAEVVGEARWCAARPRSWARSSR
jgi:hypothetical protein